MSKTMLQSSSVGNFCRKIKVRPLLPTSTVVLIYQTWMDYKNYPWNIHLFTCWLEMGTKHTDIDTSYGLAWASVGGPTAPLAMQMLSHKRVDASMLDTHPYGWLPAAAFKNTDCASCRCLPRSCQKSHVKDGNEFFQSSGRDWKIVSFHCSCVS